MITELYKQVVQGNEVRKNLIELRKLIKDYHNKRAFMYELDGDYSTLYTLLEDEDAKNTKKCSTDYGRA